MRKNTKKTKIIVSIIILFSLIYGYIKFFAATTVSTDNAYLKSDIIPIVVKVSGFVKEIKFLDNDKVTTDQVLFIIEPNDYQDKVNIQANELKIAEANLVLAQKDMGRAKKLNQDDFASQKMVDQAENKLIEADAKVEKSKAEFDIALRNLDYTQIKSPVPGFLNNRTVSVGQFVREGQVIGYLVSANDIWAEANFKETQITNIKTGQKVKIEVDAYPDQDFQGVVDSLAKATGADFSILPPENATGNFTKIVRRIPVKIKFDQHHNLELLKSGLSARVTVITK